MCAVGERQGHGGMLTVARGMHTVVVPQKARYQGAYLLPSPLLLLRLGRVPGLYPLPFVADVGRLL